MFFSFPRFLTKITLVLLRLHFEFHLLQFLSAISLTCTMMMVNDPVILIDTKVLCEYIKKLQTNTISFSDTKLLLHLFSHILTPPFYTEVFHRIHFLYVPPFSR